MRGDAARQAMVLSPLTPDQLVPQGHPIRPIRAIVDRALMELSAVFKRMYAEVGRPSLPAEHLLKGSLLSALYSIRSERQFWERLLGHQVVREFFAAVVVDVMLTRATGTAEREAALDMLERVQGTHRITVGADRNYDTVAFVQECREMTITPHVACRIHTSLDRRTTRHDGYRLSQRMRRRIEEVFGWVKTFGGGRKLRYCGVARNQLWAELRVAAYNLVRMAKLALAPSATIVPRSVGDLELGPQASLATP